MATINLLPWREERRQELLKEFAAITGAFAVVAAVIVLVWMLLLNMAITSQEGRNSFIKTRISELDGQVREIASLRQQKQQLIERMRVIQSLQGNRPEIVHLFDEIVQTLPDGVFYKSITRSGNTMKLSGTAESANRVSSLMRALDASVWFDAPNLTGVKANKSFGEQGTDFDLSVKIINPYTAQEAASAPASKKKKKKKK